MGESMIADTSALIDHLRGIANASRADATTTITVFELLKLKKNPKSAATIEALLSRLYVYPLTEKATRAAAEINLALQESGKMVNLLDVLIAGIAVENGETVLTSDRDFKVIEEVFGMPRVILLR